MIVDDLRDSIEYFGSWVGQSGLFGDKLGSLQLKDLDPTWVFKVSFEDGGCNPVRALESTFSVERGDDLEITGLREGIKGLSCAEVAASDPFFS